MTATGWHTQAEPVARLENVRIFRRGRLTLSVDALDLQPGECLGIIGPNGAGKSTLLSALSGFLMADAGTITLFGQRVSNANATRLRKRVATVSQLSAVDPRLPITVHESVMTGGFGKLGLWRRPGRALADKAARMMELTGIGHLAGRPLGLISGGERQRTAIARALTQEPDILLLDEPTSALDWKAQREILALIRDIHAEIKLCVALVTHDLNALPGMCTRVVQMQGGSICWSGPAAEALDPARLTGLYGTPFQVISHAGTSVVLF
ncbi:MAG: ABC transporter ATP-binding protein [Desulfovibrio sp.]|nr:ABC transporter ATP-binding protein [Desulfovibrio sp.]MBI4961269.1 ABC transporter ATP-binding protein [Desulfovibrio sp.]